MPAQLGPFDYRVPDELASQIQPGQLVTIPLRKSTVYGLVFDIQKEISEEAKNADIKEVLSIVQQTPIIQPSFFSVLISISTRYAVSLATLAKLAMLPMQKRKLSKLSLEEIIPPSTQRKPNHSAHQYKNRDDQKKLLEGHISGPTLILVPEKRHVEEVQRRLTHHDLIPWHSDLTVKEQFENWMRIRSQQQPIVVGTRSAALLPIPNLETIIVEHAHDTQHKQWEQHPRFDARDIAILRAELEETNLFLHSASPSATMYHDIYKDKIEGSLDLKAHIEIILINMHHERRAGYFDGISQQLRERIESTQGDIFIFVHKKGFARSIFCDSCGHIEECPYCTFPLLYKEKDNSLRCNYCRFKKPLPPRCTSCSGEIFKLRGRGTEAIEKELKKIVQAAHLPHAIIRIDGDTEKPESRSNGPRIIVGTIGALSYIDWNKTDLIGCIDLDGMLRLPEYRAEEEVWHLIHDIIFEKKSEARMMIQTYSPDHLVFRSLSEPDRFYRTHLNMRKKHGYPPYTAIIRYLFAHPKEDLAMYEAEKGVHFFRTQLTKMGLKGTVSEAIELHPRYLRGKFWYSIVVKLLPQDQERFAKMVHPALPRGWSADPNPHSLLSP